MPNISFFACAAALAGALLVAPGRADAADAAGKFAIKGAGAAPCSTFVEARTRRLTDRLVAFEGWLHGYLTAHNRLDSGTFDVVAWQGNGLLMAALESFCKANGDQRFEIAVTALVNTLRTDRIAEESEMIQIKSGDRTILLYREVVLRLQKALIQRKLYAGKADGRFGDDTRRAVEAFQKSQNLQVTGMPDQRTLLALLPSSAPAGAQPPAGAKPATPGRSTRPQPAPSR